MGKPPSDEAVLELQQIYRDHAEALVVGAAPGVGLGAVERAAGDAGNLLPVDDLFAVEDDREEGEVVRRKVGKTGK